MKLAILFCLVAFACVAQAQNEFNTDVERGEFIDSLREKLEAAKDKIGELINKATGILKEKIAEAKKKADELTDKLKQGATKISDQVYKALQKVLDTVSELEDAINQQSKRDDAYKNQPLPYKRAYAY